VESDAQPSPGYVEYVERFFLHDHMYFIPCWKEEWLVEFSWLDRPVSVVLNFQALSVRKVYRHQSGLDSSVTLVILILTLAKLLVIREADVTIWNRVSFVHVRLLLASKRAYPAAYTA
jgi:hypothetical protein